MPSAGDRVFVVSDDPVEAAALSVAMTAAGSPTIPSTLGGLTDGGIVILMRRDRVDQVDLREVPVEAILIVAGPPDIASMLTAIEHGALAYVEADAPYDRFVEAVAAARRREATVPPHMLGALLHRVIEQQREQRSALAQLDVLSPRELEVFELVVQGTDKYELASRLFISPETARTHIQNVMNKLGASSRIELVGFAAAAGLPTIGTEGVDG